MLPFLKSRCFSPSDLLLRFLSQNMPTIEYLLISFPVSFVPSGTNSIHPHSSFCQNFDSFLQRACSNRVLNRYIFTYHLPLPFNSSSYIYTFLQSIEEKFSRARIRFWSCRRPSFLKVRVFCDIARENVSNRSVLASRRVNARKIFRENIQSLSFSPSLHFFIE